MLALIKGRRSEASKLSPEREALAEAIRNVAAAEAALRENERTRAEATERVYAARDGVDAADEGLAQLADDAKAYVLKRAKGVAGDPAALRRRGPTPLEKKARAEHDLAVWKAVREASVGAADELAATVRAAQMALDAAHAAVIQAEAEAIVAPLLDRIEALVAEERVLRLAVADLQRAGRIGGALRQRIQATLGLFGASPPYCLSDFRPDGSDAHPIHVALESALNRLKEDATASLPSAAEIRRADA